MKLLFIISMFFILYFNIAEAQTNANIPDPENVLVVYNSSVAYSDSIMHYYVNARGIPYPTNVVELTLPRQVINVGDWSDPHVVKLGFDNQNIVDSTWAKWDSTHCVDTAKFHAWQYFLDEVATPIRDHLDNNDLTETVRYIVMCQGVPYKIQAVGDWSSPGNISVDGLLCMLNTEDYDDFVEAIFNNLVDDCYPGCTGFCVSSPIISNPYFDEDSDFDFDSRFEPDYYTGSWGGYTYKLSYLVSRLDALSFEVIKDIIDKSVDADKSGEAAWILDNDPASSGIGVNSQFTTAKSRLENYGFNVVYNNTDTWITHNTYDDSPVMGYTSLGVHAQGSDTAYQRYVKDSLLFDYANGSVFNTYESFNCYSISTLRRVGQGVMTEFTSVVGGTSGAGHIWEPWSSAVSKAQVYFPYYAMGYNQIDAVWQGYSYLAWRNVVVGDPLTTIAWGKQDLVDDLIWEGTNLVTGEIFVPLNNSITLEDSTVVNFRHDGFITGDGFVLTEGEFTFNIITWDKSAFRSADDNHPKLIWGAHPADSLVECYKIYRKWESTNYELLDSVNESTFHFIDEEVDINVALANELPKNADYYITAVLAEESDSSNHIGYWVERTQKISVSNNISGREYSLSQNYPNPFNPTTTIKYSLRDDGIASLKVYNILGSEIAELVNEQKSAGEYSATFDFSDLASGTYFYVLRVNSASGGFVDVKKMVLLK